MNLLTPNDFVFGQRRKSVCNGALLSTSTSEKGGSNNNSVHTTPSKRKENRRKSLSEPPFRRPSLVQRWSLLSLNKTKPNIDIISSSILCYYQFKRIGN